MKFGKIKNNQTQETSSKVVVDPNRNQKDNNPLISKEEVNIMIIEEWNKAKSGPYTLSFFGVIVGVLMLFLGFVPYATVRHYEGVYPNGQLVAKTYNLYQSSIDSYGVYHCAVIFHMIVIVLLFLNLFIVQIQIIKNTYSANAYLFNLLLNFVTFGLSITLAIFHMVSADQDYYYKGEAGPIVLALFTWMIAIVYFSKMIISINVSIKLTKEFLKLIDKNKK